MTGSLTKEKALLATMDWQGLRLENTLPPRYAKQLTGSLDGHVALAVRKWKFNNGSYGGDIHLLNGELHYTSFQSSVARFLNQRALLEMPLTRTQFSRTWDKGALSVEDIDIRAGDDIGVKGDFAMDDAQELSGQLWVGAKPEYLKWLPDAENTIFTHKEGGLVWAHVKLSGTIKKPGQDLGAQVMTQLKRHPLAMVGLGFKLVSWYVGNWFGMDKEWKRPETPNRLSDLNR